VFATVEEEGTVTTLLDSSSGDFSPMINNEVGKSFET